MIVDNVSSRFVKREAEHSSFGVNCDLDDCHSGGEITRIFRVFRFHGMRHPWIMIASGLGSPWQSVPYVNDG